MRSQRPSALVVTVVHHPEDARIRHRQIPALLAAGWDVTYVAPFTGYGLPVPAPVRSATGELRCADVPRAVWPAARTAMASKRYSSSGAPWCATHHRATPSISRRLRAVTASSGWPRASSRRPFTSTKATTRPRRMTRSISWRRKRTLRSTTRHPRASSHREANDSKWRPTWCVFMIGTMPPRWGRFHGAPGRAVRPFRAAASTPRAHPRLDARVQYAADRAGEEELADQQ